MASIDNETTLALLNEFDLLQGKAGMLHDVCSLLAHKDECNALMTIQGWEGFFDFTASILDAVTSLNERVCILIRESREPFDEK